MKKRNLKSLTLRKIKIASPKQNGIKAGLQNQKDEAPIAVTVEYSPCALYTVYIGNQGCPSDKR